MVRRAHAAFPSAELIHAYGAAETAPPGEIGEVVVRRSQCHAGLLEQTRTDRRGPPCPLLGWPHGADQLMGWEESALDVQQRHFSPSPLAGEGWDGGAEPGM